jgi:hypothetical protein
MIKQAHYQFAPEMRPRYKRDKGVTVNSFRSRATTFDLLRDIDPVLANPRLVSSSFGSIDRVLFSTPSYVFEYPSYLMVYEDLLEKLPSATKFIFLVHENVRLILDDLLDRLDMAGRATILEAPDFMDFTVWAEDGYAVTQDNGAGSSYFVEPASFNRYDDSMIADIVAAKTDLDLYHASLYFQGGNILIGDDFWLLGTDYANKSVKLGLVRPGDNEPLLKAIRRSYGQSLDNWRKLHLVASAIPVPHEIERQFILNGQQWTEVLYGGNEAGTVQPMFHIDMFITLAGRDDNGNPIVLVGDPSEASRILGESLQPHAMALVYDNIAGNLEKQGFHVVRNPLPLVYQDDPSERKRYWYFATSNNALVEIRGTEKKVWLPTYGHGPWSNLAKTDAANRQVWEDLDFQVTMLTDFHPFAFNQGAAHCINKYLARG